MFKGSMRPHLYDKLWLRKTCRYRMRPCNKQITLFKRPKRYNCAIQLIKCRKLVLNLYHSNFSMVGRVHLSQVFQQRRLWVCWGNRTGQKIYHLNLNSQVNESTPLITRAKIFRDVGHKLQLEHIHKENSKRKNLLLAKKFQMAPNLF